jgi:hypothetical protein
MQAPATALSNPYNIKAWLLGSSGTAPHVGGPQANLLRRACDQHAPRAGPNGSLPDQVKGLEQRGPTRRAATQPYPPAPLRPRVPPHLVEARQRTSRNDRSEINPPSR